MMLDVVIARWCRVTVFQFVQFIKAIVVFVVGFTFTKLGSGSFVNCYVKSQTVRNLTPK